MHTLWVLGDTIWVMADTLKSSTECILSRGWVILSRCWVILSGILSEGDFSYFLIIFLENFREKVQPPRARKCDRGRKKRRGGRTETNFDVDFSSIFDLFFIKK